MDLTPEQLLNGIRNSIQQGVPDTGIDILRQLLSLPHAQTDSLGQGWEEVMALALRLADEDAALGAAHRLLDIYPNNGRYALIFTERLSRVGRSEDALNVMGQLKAGMTPNAAIDHLLGVYSGHIGKLDEAAEYFRSALSMKEDLGDSWSNLATLGRIEAKDIPVLERLIEEKAEHALPGAAYALGEWYHSQGEHAKAWDYWTRANEASKRGQTFSIDEMIAPNKGIPEADRRIWTDKTPLQPKPPRPIFIVGPPRSGTTLTEQIIRQQKNVGAMGETMLSRASTWPLGNLGPSDLEKVGAFGPPGVTWERLGAIYRHLASNRTQEKPITTDKGAILHLFVGALARMLPNAKFVWVRRNLKDVALSAYRTNLTDGNRWRHDMRHAATYLRAFDEIMRYWQSQFPDRIFELEYERLVTSPQTNIDQLTRFLDLDPIDASKIDMGASNVPTASFAQIRSKISAKSVRGWKAYEEWIAPGFES